MTRTIARRLFFGTLLTAALLVAASPQTALDTYVKAPDASYKYELVATVPGNGYTMYVIDLTSQTWRKPSEVDRTVWKHWLTIIKPDKPYGNTGLLFINGGNIDAKPPVKPDMVRVEIAMKTNTVVADLRGVPNEPVTFAGESAKRTEDGIIAYTWDKFMKTGDETWPLRLPMTKAAVRAMDTVTSFCAKPENGGVKVEKFVVSGGSKRGWTTWTAAIVDKRVVAIAPLVIDLLHVQPSFAHHWRVYGFFAPAVKDYEEMGLMERFWTPEADKLMRIEDPYYYLDRLTIPKFLINAGGDQFFLPDSWQFYWNDLKGEKNIRYIPNTDHSLRNSDAPFSLASFYESIVYNRPRPRVDWKVLDDGTIRVTAFDKPTEVKLWTATNPDARDFRLEKIGPVYKSVDVADVGSGLHVYVAKVPKPEKGFTAGFIELTFKGAGNFPIKITTGVKVMPDVYPFPPFKGSVR